MDLKNKKPIEGVKVQLFLGLNKEDTCDLVPKNGFTFKDDPLLTDSNGYFEFGMNTGLRPEHFYLSFSRNGYDDLILNGDSLNNNSTLKISLVPNQK